MKMVPVVFIWREVDVVDGDGVVCRQMAMVPEARYGNIVARQFHDGEAYPLVVLEARSRASHNGYFAALHDGFLNLPEDLAEVAERLNIKTIPGTGFRDEEHLRKWALCETGHCDVEEFDFDTKEDAHRLARFYRRRDDYSQILVRGTHVTIKTARSQSAAAMSKEPFEKSKRDVLNLIEAMIGLKKGTLNKNAGRAA